MKEFLDYIKNEENKAENTVLAYKRDISAFELFLNKREIPNLLECTHGDAIAYIIFLKNENKSKATINRKISSIRAYYARKLQVKAIESNPFDNVKTAKSDKREIDYLSMDEINALLKLPDNTLKGLRDQALLEVMYGTGARVTEINKIKNKDINFKMNFITCRDGQSNSRIIPLGSYAHKALEKYMNEGYCAIKRSATIGIEDFIFINFSGKPLTRQGVWKIVKDYGSKIGIETRMTPQILRNTFAVHMLQNGADLKTLQELMGFDDISVGMAYLSVTNNRVKDVFNRSHPRA
ncbi:MAG: tyrosine-type recombinase/integrase [Peptostreptococcaceae bacterium]|nr:tyrosine-type recombinase/integrase [Peptostreptococcaceae bacterium]